MPFIELIEGHCYVTEGAAVIQLERSLGIPEDHRLPMVIVVEAKNVSVEDGMRKSRPNHWLVGRAFDPVLQIPACEAINALCERTRKVPMAVDRVP